MLTSIFGTVVEVKQMSTKDRMERKKYMGVCRCEADIMARIMSRFPSTVIRYMDRNSPKRMGCSSGFSESPIRWNSGIIVRLGSSVLLGHLFKTKRIGNGKHIQRKQILKQW
jgi:hypothetical protein